jgi:sulfite exporter TauE/SafE
VPLIAAGLSNEQVADVLHLSVDTIKTHLRRTYKTVGARDRAHLVTWAYLTGMLTVPVPCRRVHMPTVAEAAAAHGVPLTHAADDQGPPRR